jgi:acetolactate synthase-1/2/3 large subunit
MEPVKPAPAAAHENENKHSPAAFPQAELGREMKGADSSSSACIREGVDVIFAYPGGASQELHQALARTDKIRVILPRHEQGGSFAAEGYARATGKVGVCMATSGPGATNLVSAIADAFMDSIPMVAITGQVFSKYIGKMAFQETDFYGMTLPIVKHSYLVLNVHDLPRVFKEAFHLARSGTPGSGRDRHPEGRAAGEISVRCSRPRWSSATPTPGPSRRAR